MMNPRHNTRQVRAPRGTEISTKSWLTEAPLRMLMNNLDAEVAENPNELVVYGGIGRAARDLGRLRPHRREPARRSRTTRPCSSSPASRSACSAPTSRCTAGAHRQLQPRAALGDVGPLQRARSQGPDDVRPDDRRVVDLHRHPGHRAGHLRDLRRGGAQALRWRPRRQVDPDRRPRRHGRRAAARRDDGRRLLPRGRVPARPHRFPPAHPLRRRDQGRDARRSAGDHRSGLHAEGRPVSVGLLGNAAEVFPEMVRRGIRPRHR